MNNMNQRLGQLEDRTTALENALSEIRKAIESGSNPNDKLDGIAAALAPFQTDESNPGPPSGTDSP